jgi:ribosomal protein L18E
MTNSVTETLRNTAPEDRAAALKAMAEDLENEKRKR